MRNYTCNSTITKHSKGTRCGKYAEYQTDEGEWVCQACYWRYKRASGRMNTASETRIVDPIPA